MCFCNEELTKKSIGYNPVNKVSVCIDIKKYDKPIVKVEDGELIIKCGKVEIGGAK